MKTGRRDENTVFDEIWQNLTIARQKQ